MFGIPLNGPDYYIIIIKCLEKESVNACLER